MDDIRLVHYESKNVWEIDCDTLPSHIKLKLNQELTDYSSNFYSEDGEYEGGVDFMMLKSITLQFSDNFHLSFSNA